MVGNAAEEGLMQQIGNPSHVDLARISVPAGAICAMLTFFLVQRIGGVVLGILASVIVFPIVALPLHRWLSRLRYTKEEAARQAYRDQREQERARQLAEMKREVRS